MDISVKDNVLTITASKESERKDETDMYCRRERFFGSVNRVLTLPGHINDQEASAELKNGVLTLTLPKRKDTAQSSRKIKVQG